MYSPFYAPHDGQAACIKERCVDNAVGLDAGRLAAVSVCAAVKGAKQIGFTGWSDGDDGSVLCASGTSVKSHKTDREMATRIDRRFFSYERSPNCYMCFYSCCYMS